MVRAGSDGRRQTIKFNSATCGGEKHRSSTIKLSREGQQLAVAATKPDRIVRLWLVMASCW